MPQVSPPLRVSLIFSFLNGINDFSLLSETYKTNSNGTAIAERIAEKVNGPIKFIASLCAIKVVPQKKAASTSIIEPPKYPFLFINQEFSFQN